MRISSATAHGLLAASLVYEAMGVVAPQSMTEKAVPMQAFYIPLPEEAMLYQMFKNISSDGDSPIATMLSLAISTDNTVIWYDHWEDGYERDILNPTSARTEIWGDGDASNGCAPTIKPADCTNAKDVLMAGDVVNIQNDVPVPRNPFNYTGILYDGGDRVEASYPIAITRAAFPNNAKTPSGAKGPGSLMAGGIEVFDTDNWGYEFVAPVGTDIGTNLRRAFTYTAFFVMAKEPTVLTLPSGATRELDRGRGTVISVRTGDKLVADKPVQVDLITGDIGSNYELRWFALPATENWGDEYWSPVGDTKGDTRVIIYNPSNSAISVVGTHLEGSSEKKNTYSVGAKAWLETKFVPLGSGLHLKGNGKFFAISLTDTQHSGGQIYDWGFPLMPAENLSPQVLVGMGYGCTDNKCGCNSAKTLCGPRSVIWITAVEDAFIFIDYKNQGSGHEVRQVKKLQSIKIIDTSDNDMSGALIFATKENNINSKPVNIAAAWGQDPLLSESNDYFGLDLGTVVLPFSSVRVSKTASAVQVSPGNKLTYTIRVANVGQTAIPAGGFTIVDPRLDGMTYVPGTTRYSADGGLTREAVPDNTVGTPFPLDGAGLTNLYELSRRGGTHEVSFEVVVEPTLIKSTSVVNNGWLEQNTRPDQLFSATTPLVFSPSISIQNTVRIGHGNAASCADSVESVSGNYGTDVTYCFLVTNTGNTYLQKPKIENGDVSYTNTRQELLAPGESYTVVAPRQIKETFQNHARVEAIPAFFDGSLIPNVAPVAHTDPSDVAKVDVVAGVRIVNTVLEGQSAAISSACAQGGQEKIITLKDEPVTYCFTVENTGNSFLSITVTNPKLANYLRKHGPLAPGSKYTVAVPMKAEESLVNTAFVVGKSVLLDGTALPNTPEVKDDDPSEVMLVESRSGGRDPFTPPGSNDYVTGCMHEHWKDSGANPDLQCKAKEVFLVSLINTEKISCTVGSMVDVTLVADVQFRSARYDPTFFIATDGGDAMTGSCVLRGLEQGTSYSVVDPNDSRKVVGSVAWNKDHKGGNDKCGDVFINGGGGGVVSSTLVTSQVKCVDRDHNGALDISVCFSWRTAGNDGFCTLTNDDPKTKGKLADAYPGNPAKCFCDTYEVEGIEVEPIKNQVVDVC